MQDTIKSNIGLFVFMSGLATLLGLLAPYQPYMDIINNFRAHIIVILLFFFLLAELSGKRGSAFWAAILLLANVFLALPNFYFTAPVVAGNGQSIRVMAFNIDGVTQNSGSVVTMLQQENADIVLLLSVDRDQMTLLDQLGSLYPYQAVCAGEFLCRMALLSKLELKNITFSNRDKGVPPVITATTRINQTKVHLIGTNLSSPLCSQNAQRAEIAYMTEKIAKIDGPIIALGSFNSTPWSWELSSLQLAADLSRHRTLGANWPAGGLFLFPQFLVDHVMTRGSFSTENAYTGQRSNSGYFPVIVDLSGP